MSDDVKDPGWPEEAGRVTDLPHEREPAPDLEDRVVRGLIERGLIAPGRRGVRRPAAGRIVLAAAAALVLVAAGFVAGRAGRLQPPPDGPSAAAAGTQYALLLYETQGYDAPTRTEALERYREYSRWVAEARRRGQFLDGEDLSVEQSWVLAPGPLGPQVRRGAVPGEAAPLSGVFLITATEPERALALAESLPHLRYGGQVVLQEVVPTDEPPSP